MYDLRSKDELATERPRQAAERPRQATERPEFPARIRKDPEEDYEGHQAGRWIVAFLLVVAIAGLCWYGYPTLKKVPGMLAQFPTIQKSLEGINAQLADSENRFKAWSNNQIQLQEHVAEVEKAMGSSIQAVRKQAQDLSERVYQRVHADLAAQNQVTDARIARLESSSQADRANVEKLQNELAAVHQDTASQIQSVRSEMDREGADRDQKLVTLNEQVGRQSRDVEGLSQKLAVKRVPFEVTRNHSQHLTEDVSLGVTGTDISHNSITGWMWVMPDRRTIWLRGQGVQQPVVFYNRDGKRSELVITNVAKNSVSGYLILPADGSTDGSAPPSKGD